MDRPLAYARLHLLRAAGEITANQLLVGRALVRRSNHQGACWPSEATIAIDAGCCERTVRRAKLRFIALGFLRWTSQRLGKRRAVCRYRVSTPPPPCKPQNFPAPKMRDKSLMTFPAIVSAPRQLSPEVERALARLGAAMGIQPSQVAPWLA